jgi:hypothetical protein
MWKNIVLKAALFALVASSVNASILQGFSLAEKALILGGVFAVLNHFAYRHIIERFDNPDTRVDQPCPPNSVKCPSGDCKLKTDIYGMC